MAEKLKVLAISDESGSKYHRIRLPMELTHEVESRIMTHDKADTKDLEWCDILFFNGHLNMPTYYLSILREQYNFKIVMDVDDYWEVPNNFPNKSFLTSFNNDRIGQMIMSDTVICSTEKIRTHVLKLNPNVHVIPNRIPYGYGQFLPTIGTKLTQKLMVGICGSVSHYPDYQILVSVINKISRDKKLRDSIQFVIAGYDERSKEVWDSIVAMFRGLDYIILHSKPVDKYMDLYDNIEVLLAPLADNEFNRCKSDLKLQEAISKQIVVVSTNVYSKNGSLIKYQVASNTDEWIDVIRNYSVLFESSARNPYSTFKQENDKRIGIISGVVNTSKPYPKNLKINSITYAEDQITEYPKIFNDINNREKKSYLFEYNPIMSFFENIKYSPNDYIGMFSHKFPHKTFLSRDMLIKKLIDSEYENFDVIGLSPELPFCKKRKYYAFTESQHPGFMELFGKICAELGLATKEPPKIVYSNFFIAKYSFWKEYVKELKKAIRLMETKYKDLAWQDSSYKSGLVGEELKKQTGLEYYPMHTFILERLLSAYLTTHGEIKFKQLS